MSRRRKGARRSGMRRRVAVFAKKLGKMFDGWAVRRA